MEGKKKSPKVYKNPQTPNIAYATNKTAFKHRKPQWWEVQEEINKCTFLVGGFERISLRI